MSDRPVEEGAGQLPAHDGSGTEANQASVSTTVPGPAGTAGAALPGGSASSQGGMFRQQALERMNVREALDSALHITSRPLWVALAACLVAVAAAVVWAVAGNAPVTVSATGVLLPESGVVEIPSTSSGVVSDLPVGVGVQVAAGQSIATLIGPSGKPVEVTSAVSGTIDEQFVSQGSFVGPGTPIAELLPSSSPISAVMFVSAAAGKVVRVGMAATISPSTAPPSNYGSIKGTVEFVSPLPVTQQKIVSLVGQRQGLVGAATRLGAPLEVVISLKRNPESPSGYAWTSGNGPDFPITPGTILSGSILVANQKPISVGL